MSPGMALDPVAPATNGKRHPLDPLTADEITAASAAVRASFGDAAVRFVAVTLDEPCKTALAAHAVGEANAPPRSAQAIIVIPATGRAYEVYVDLPAGAVARVVELPPGIQPALTPDDCFLAEEIVKKDARVATLLREGYGVTDMALVAADPWSIHIATPDYAPLRWRQDGVPPRLVQTFLYRRDDADDNHYAHPLHFVPVVDLNAERVVAIEGEDRPAPESPQLSVNYHRNKLASNSYLAAAWRSDVLAPLNVVQPDGPSFQVHGTQVTWQKWTLRVGFNYREGLVLHDVCYDGRSVLARGSLVEMAVPYGDPNPPFEKKCAFDVGDYGLGFCANSLELGCDCLGHIHYFDAVLNDSKGEPWVLRKAVCMHEEDAGLLWKHVDYRCGHSEARRSRRLVLSFIATVVNYEYLFYWHLLQDGTIEFEIKLSGELSTNMLSAGEAEPGYGTIVAPGVNAQVHQHMFCMRLDMAVDGPRNCVSEVNVQAVDPTTGHNPFGNAFVAVKTPLRTESEAQRVAAPARTWRVHNPRSFNAANGQPVAYKLVPHTRGSVQPLLLTSPDCAVTKRGGFATRSLWVTPYCPEERFPAGEYPTQSVDSQGLPEWCKADRNIDDEDVVIWHSFGVAHVPRVEDFPVMPCEVTGFTLKPDGFFAGNPAIDLPPDSNVASKCCSHN